MRGMDRQPPRPMDPMEGNQMRVIFNEGLKAVADDLDHMARNVRDAIHGAGQALLNADLDAAQTVIDNDAETDALSTSIVDQCVELLARQNPVATDLRCRVSTMRLAITFERMGDLARHIAESARRTYPDLPLPQEIVDTFAQMQQFLDVTADRLVTMLADRDTKVADQIIHDDDVPRRPAQEDARVRPVRRLPGHEPAAHQRGADRPLHGAPSATMPSPPRAVWSSSSPDSTRRRNRTATKAPTSTDGRRTPS